MINTIISGKNAAQREEAFTALYQSAFPLVARYVSKMGGSLEEAKDVFHDALVAYYEKTRTGPLSLRYSDKSYLLGIAKHLWHKRYHTLANTNTGSQHFPEADTFLQEDMMEEMPSTSRLLKLLHTAGHKCMQLLKAFYYDKHTMKALAGKFGFSSEHSATVQKFKCLEKVKNTVKEKALSYADFLE